MKKFLYIILFLPIFFTGCRRGDIQINDYWYHIKTCKLPYVVDFFVDVNYRGSKIEYYWDFGDGTTSNDQNPTHKYTSTGVYKVTLTIVNYKKTETISFDLNLSQDSYPIDADFDYYPVYGNYYVPAEIQFINNSQFASEFFWNFGDGYGSKDFEPTHTYYNADTVEVILKAFCNDFYQEKSKKIIIYPPPTSITVEKVTIDMPSEYDGIDVRLVCYVGFHRESDINCEREDVFFPQTWNLDHKLFYFDGEYDYTSLNFELEDINTEEVIYSFGTSFAELQDEHYPTYLSWEDSGFKAEVYLSYGY